MSLPKIGRNCDGWPDEPVTAKATTCQECGADTGPAFGLCSACIKTHDARITQNNTSPSEQLTKVFVLSIALKSDDYEIDSVWSTEELADKRIKEICLDDYWDKYGSFILLPKMVDGRSR